MNSGMDPQTYSPEVTPPPTEEPLPDGTDAPRPGRRGCLPVAAGIALVLIGIPMLVCPGPGVAVIASGFGMIAVGLGLKRGNKGS